MIPARARLVERERVWRAHRAPGGCGLAFWRWACRSDGAAYWERGGEVVVGAGVMTTLVAAGEPFGSLVEAAGELWPRLVVDAPVAPRLLGGVAFAPGWGDDAWRPFGDGRFTLPRWTYVDDGAEAWLCGEGDFDEALAALAGVAPEPVVEAPVVAAEAWGDRVAAALAAIEAGTLDKVVCARRVEARRERPFDAGEVLAALPTGPQVTRFGFRHGGRVFLGASPERLVARSGSEVRSEALAGTSLGGEGLTGSVKDRLEQRLVSEEIGRRLAPLCTRVDAPAEPQLKGAPGMVHLATPITGRLASDLHVLLVARELHPTPAVGGLPGAAAVAWLREHEPPRGWYGGPVGWFDAAGDGELAVAIRSGLLDGNRALAFAGAGLVRGSTYAGEHAETDWKLRPLLRALGAT